MFRKIISLCLVLITALPALVHADAFEKLGRGATNTVLGWTEVFIEPGKRFDKNHNVAEGMTGVGVGIVKGLTRTMAGVYEVISFPFPVPEDYDSIIEPEFPWKPQIQGIEDIRVKR